MQVIQNRWYAVLSAAELGRERPVGRRRFARDVVFWRDAEGRVAAAADRCPHRRAKLSLGRVKDGCLECPFHGFTFDSDGACRSIPAHPDRAIPKAMALHSLPVREAHGFVWLWTGPDPAPAEPIPFFDLEGYRYDGSELTESVDVHYTLAIENQLDFAHLPFVHATTIGRLVDERATEVTTEVEGDRIRAWAGSQDGLLELLGPNAWRLRVGPQWQVVVFVPVDEDRMLYYLRTYQRLVTLPGLAWLFGRLQRAFNRIVLRQDSAVVRTIPPGETRLKGLGEILVPSDAPIIAYRRWREAHRGPFDPLAEPVVAPSRLVRTKLAG